MKAELDKCVLLCANCHREVGAGVTQLPEAILVEKRGEFGEVQSAIKIDRIIPSQAIMNQTP